MTAPVALERAGVADLDALVALERACFREPWTRGNLEMSMDPARGYTMLLLRAPGPSLAGYCCHQMVVDEMHVHNVAVHPDWRGRGLGRVLVGEALRLAARAGARMALLEVRPSNEPALALYRGLGFHPLSVRRGYYSAPREDALVMRKLDLLDVLGDR